MHISQKCQYALRALFELSKREGEGPVTAGRIAEAQAIPVKFLEQILSQLKQGGYVESRRGKEGGYLLVRSPSSMTMGEVIEFIEGPLGPVRCISGDAACPFRGGECAFLDVWEEARRAVLEVYRRKTFQGLVEDERAKRTKAMLSYDI